MKFSEIKYPKHPIPLTVKLGGGVVKIDGIRRRWALSRPISGEPIFIIDIVGFGRWAVSIESILEDIIKVARRGDENITVHDSQK